MNEQKAKAYLRKRLYQVDPLFARSEEEAKTLAAECRVSARALILRAEAASELPAASWSGFYDALDAADRKAAGGWREKLREAAQTMRRHRRLALGSLILVLALAFFTLVPAGRAIAESIFSYVITVFDKRLEIEQTDEKALYDERGYDVPEVMTDEQIAAIDENGQVAIESEPVYYNSVADFNAAYSLDAFAFASDKVTCTEVYETDHIFTGKSLWSHYETTDGKTINVIEQWYIGDGQSISVRGEIKEQTVLDGRTMQYAIDSENGTFDGVVLLDDTVLRIYADAGVSLDLIWDLLA